MTRNRKRFRGDDSTTVKFVLFALVATFGAVIAWQIGWTGYVETWVGTTARAVGGGVTGFLFSRFGVGLRLGDIGSESVRAEAAKSQALMIVGFALASAIGV